MGLTVKLVDLREITVLGYSVTDTLLEFQSSLFQLIKEDDDCHG